MEFVRYNKLEDFMKENFELILEKEWLNCLMVGNCLEGEKIGYVKRVECEELGFYE